MNFSQNSLSSSIVKPFLNWGVIRSITVYLKEVFKHIHEQCFAKASWSCKEQYRSAGSRSFLICWYFLWEYSLKVWSLIHIVTVDCSYLCITVTTSCNWYKSSVALVYANIFFFICSNYPYLLNANLLDDYEISKLNLYDLEFNFTTKKLLLVF